MDEEVKKICLQTITVTEQNADDPEVLEKVEKLDELFYDLQQYEEDSNAHLSKEFMHDLMEVIEQNLFRALPPCNIQKEHVNLSPQFSTDVCNVVDPQMKILNSVYILLDSLVKILKKSEDMPIYISESFIERLFNILFQSEDELERQMVCTNLENIYTHVECRAKQINDLLYQSLTEIIDKSNKKDVSYSSTETLLYFQLFVITNEDNPKYLPKIDKLFSVLTKLHKVHYLFNFYKILYSCSLLLLKKHPLHLVSYTQNVLRICKEPVQSSPSFVSTNRSLFLIELNHILQLLLRLIKEAKDESTKLKFEDFFHQLVKPIVDFSLFNLKSNNAALVGTTIKMLTKADYHKYFRNHPDIVQRILPLMQNDPNFLQWHEQVYAKQSLYRASLIVESELVI